MHFDTQIELVTWKENIVRTGLSGTYHQAVFRISSDGIEPFETAVFVHPQWPEREKVARSFLHARLQEGLQNLDVFTPAALDKLWQEVKPNDDEIAT